MFIRKLDATRRECVVRRRSQQRPRANQPIDQAVTGARRNVGATTQSSVARLPLRQAPDR
jgi:hypothetical protein